MSKIKDLTGKVFGKWTVISIGHKSKHRQYFWDCLCICGNSKKVLGTNLRKGKSKSCGCISTKSLITMNSTHGKTGTPSYSSWCSMSARCRDERNKYYHRYGGRGIKICKRWEKFENFYEDMGERPEKKSLDRIDNNGNYTPENCRWASATEQANNTSRTRYLSIEKETKTLSEWSKLSGTKSNVIRDRLYLGWSHKEAIYGKTK